MSVTPRFREHRTRTEIDRLLHFGHPIPVSRGFTFAFVAEHYPGWTWNELIAVLKAADVIVREFGMLSCDETVESIEFSGPEDFVVHRIIRLKGDEAPVTAGAAEAAATGHQTAGRSGGFTVDVAGLAREDLEEVAESLAAGLIAASSNPATYDSDTTGDYLPVRPDEDLNLIPWPQIHTRHRYSYALAMLRLEARRRAGETLRDDYEERLEKWLAQLHSLSAVVDYDSESTHGFLRVPRAGEDHDIVRRPAPAPGGGMG